MALHSALTGADLHAPGAHKTQHEDGGTDEISLTGLTGAPALASATTAVTQSPADNSTKVATTAYVDAADALKADLAGATFSGDVNVPDDAYDATTWNGSTEVPTKNAVRDKIEALGAGVAALDDLTDVDTTGVADGDVLTYDSGSGDWVAEAPTGGGGGSTTTIYVPGKNASSDAEDDDFDSDSGLWTNCNWSEQTTVDYDTTVPGALYIKHPVSASSLKLRAKLKAIPAGDWSKVLDMSVAIRNHTGLAAGLIVSQSASGSSGNQSTFGVGTQAGNATCYVIGYSNFASFNGYQVSQSGWGYGPRVLLRWDRLSGVDKVAWGVYDPHTGAHWSHPLSPAWYGSLTHYGIGYWTTNSGEATEVSFHGIYHFPTSFPVGGMGIPLDVNYTP